MVFGGLLDQRVDHALVDVDGLGRVGAQRAVRVLRAVGGVVVERRLERGGLPDVGLDRVGVGVDGAVEDHRAHVLRELLGVERPDPGAVRVAEVGQLVVAERRAHRVEILGHVGGSDVGEEVLAHLVHAALDEVLGLLLDVRDALRRVVDLGSARSRSLSASELHHTAGVDGRRRAGRSRPGRSAPAPTAGMVRRIDAAASTPDSPGPPGLMTSEPIFSPVALNRIIASWATSPSGLA